MDFGRRVLVLAGVFGVVILLAAAFLLAVESRPAPDAPSPPAGRELFHGGDSPAEALRTYRQLPLYFIPNRGQRDESVAYYVQNGGHTIAFTAGEVMVSLGKAILRTRFVGAGPTQPAGVEKQAARVNYLTGDDPSRWQTDIPTYGAVTYRNLYPGVTLRYAGIEGVLESIYTVAPGADPARIRYRYDGAASVRLDEATGDLLITLPGAEGRLLTERAPLAWQTIGGRRVSVPVRYLFDDGQIGFALPDGYDPRYPLVIDPTLEYGSYLGGSAGDNGRGIAVDDAGYVYIAGSTDSTDFPTKNAYQNGQGWADVFIVKIDPAAQDGAASLVYATYLGGSGGDLGYGLAVDESGNAYVTGWTGSSDFPTTPGAFDTTCGSDGHCDAHNGLVYYDAFVTKLNAAGNGLVYSTYVGGSNSEIVYNGIAVDGSGNAYVAGYTWSTDFPVTPGAYDTTCGTDGACNPDAQESDGYPDIFVAKLNAAGSDLVYATYLGGSQRDFALDLDLNGAGDAYVAGFTWSTDFPATANAFQKTHHGGDKDAVVVRLNAAGSDLVYATYLGGSSLEECYGIAVDGAGNAYVTGETLSSDFPTHNSYDDSLALKDAFISKLNPAGSDLLYSTYLGGSGYETGYSIAAGGNGIVYATGWTTSPDFPTTPDAYDDTCGTDGACNNAPYRHTDVFVVAVDTTQNGASSLNYASYLGGSDSDWGYAIAVDQKGNTYVAGETRSTDFPTTANAYDAACGADGNCDDPNNPLSDAFVAAFNPDLPDLSTSRKQVSPAAIALTGTATLGIVTPTLHYTITLANTGNVTATAAALTDTLPLSLTLTAGPVCSGGVCGYSAGSHTVTWGGEVGSGASVVITYSGRVSIPTGTAGMAIYIANTALVNDGANAPFTLTAWSWVNPRRLYLPLVLRNIAP